MTHIIYYQGSLIQYWEVLITESQRLAAVIGQAPFEFMSPNPQMIKEYVPKNGDEIIVYFWDKEHKHVLLVVEAALLPDEDKDMIQVVIFPQGNSFEEPAKSAMLLWKEIKTALERTDRQRKQSGTIITNNIYIGGDVKGGTIIAGDENEVKNL